MSDLSSATQSSSAAEQARLVSIPVPGRAALEGRLTLPSRAGRRPVIVVAHGFKGFLDWGFFPPLVNLLEQRGFAVLSFNFSGSGMAIGDERVTDLDAFRRATFGGDVADLEAVIRFAAESADPERIDGERLGLLGHSRGGGASILASAGAQVGGRVKALVTWAAVASFHRFSEQAIQQWRRDGVLEVVNGRTGQRLEIDVEALEELEARGDELEPAAAASKINAPWLILHGEDDATVSEADARRLDREAGAGNRQLRVIPGAGHTFGARHPFDGPNPQLIEVFNQTQVWFRRALGRG
ncbi:MAG: alpha/beta fold hydrolase [Acidobacteriota bacterium]